MDLLFCEVDFFHLKTLSVYSDRNMVISGIGGALLQALIFQLAQCTDRRRPE